MKLGVSYTVFDGIELLEYSIRQIREHVDFIHVAYQDISWFGSQMSQSDKDILSRLHRKKLIDSLDKFSDFKNLNRACASNIRTSKAFEMRKRQFGLDACVKQGCTHFISMDVDEFYKADEFKNAKNIIIERNITRSSCSFINYVNLPIYHRGYDSSSVPFICKVNASSRMSKTFFTRCDPTRGINAIAKGSDVRLPISNITMHHMETIRKDLNKKYTSTTRAVFNRARTGELVNSIKLVNEDTKTFGFNKIIFPKTPNVSLKTVDNIFKIPYATWQ